MNNFLNNEWDRAKRLKRGGGLDIFSFDGISADERYALEPVHGESPERLFERRWAETVLERVVTRLQHEFESAGQQDRFEVLKVFLLSSSRNASYERAAQQLHLTVKAVTAAVHRMRHRFRELFRAEIVKTVAGPEDVQEEIRHLLAALSE